MHILGECGAIKAAKINPAISEDLLREILLWKEEGGCSMDDILLCGSDKEQFQVVLRFIPGLKVM